jgi:ribosomal-protein-alanine N-acetyltransferase
MQIVPMQPRHLDALARLETLCFSDPWSRASLEAELQNPQALFLVCELRGEPVGYCGLYWVLDEGSIANLAVDPACRRQGVGRALLHALFDFARRQQLLFLTLEVRPSNQAARALYASEGFLPVGRRKNYYRAPVEDALLLTCRLSAQPEA